MSESRKNHLAIDGGVVKQDEHISTYKPIPESDTEFKSSKITSKSKEHISSDGAEEQLLEKQDQPKIIIAKVDMADAKYIVGDQRNGDAKIELDAGKRQFTGLTKEELQKYIDDPFWIRLRWFMFVMFWVLWLAMLAGAVAIIVRAPKCAPPTPKTWYQKGPLVDLTEVSNVPDLQAALPSLKTSKVEGIFLNGAIAGDTYKVLDEENALDQIKGFITKAKDAGVKVIVDLTANYVSKTDKWFQLSENRTGNYSDYFVWSKATQYDDNGQPKPPNNWVSTVNTPAWSWSESRKEFYLHRFGASLPDLNFTNAAVVGHFDAVLVKWMKAGVDGVRLQKARYLLVNESLSDEVAGGSPGADHTQHGYWRHRHTVDQPALDTLLLHWSHVVDNAAAVPGAGNTVFTVQEEGAMTELVLLDRNLTSLRPPSVAAVDVDSLAPVAVATTINQRLASWPALQLKSAQLPLEVAAFSLLLPAAPVLSLDQVTSNAANDSAVESLERVVALRHDASIEHGKCAVVAVTSDDQPPADLLLATRWKIGHTGYAALFNPHGRDVGVNVTRAAPSVPRAAALLLVARAAPPALTGLHNYTHNMPLETDHLLVPGRSTLIFSYVPKTVTEE